MTSDLTALLSADWQPMKTAPRDGTAIQAKIPGNGSDNIIAWMDGFLDAYDCSMDICFFWALIPALRCILAG